MHIIIYRRLLVYTVLLFFFNVANGQLLDSLEAKAGLEYRLSSGNYQPLWLVANHFGTVANLKSDLTSYVRIRNKHVLAQTETQNSQGLYDDHDFSLSYGLSLFNNNHFKSTFIEEGYAKLEYKNWSLRAGRFEETIGEVDKDLSAGSFGVSANALPIPKLGLAVTDYTNVPFTNGWLQFKGSFAHGWLGKDRYVKNSYYHEATFFLRAGARKFKIYAGVEHFAEWGGNRDGQSFGTTMKDFWNAVFIREIDKGNSETNSHKGDHRGVIEGGASWENSDFQLRAYLQKPFEGKNDIGFKTMNGLTGIVLSLKDRYMGLQKVVVEVINTGDINTDIPVNKLESYYNSNIYKTGWEYRDNIIGIPLFTNRVRGSHYFSSIQPFDWNAPSDSIPVNANIINNRIFAIHAGALYTLSEHLEGKTLLTYTENYGSSVYSSLFAPVKKQFYCLQQFTYGLDKYNLNINAALGFDPGQFDHRDVVGIMLGVEWTIPVHAKSYNPFTQQ